MKAMAALSELHRIQSMLDKTEVVSDPVRAAKAAKIIASARADV